MGLRYLLSGHDTKCEHTQKLEAQISRDLSNLCVQLLFVFQVLVSWYDDESSLGATLVAILTNNNLQMSLQ